MHDTYVLHRSSNIKTYHNNKSIIKQTHQEVDISRGDKQTCSIHFAKDQSSLRETMKGDIVNGLTFLSILPWYYYLAFSSYLDSDRSQGHVTSASLGQQFAICIAFTFTVGFCYLSWRFHSITFSDTAFVLSIVATICMNIFQWPHPGEQIVIPQYLWHLLILTANTELLLVHQVVLCLFGLLGMMVILGISPIYNIEETIPMLAGATVLHITFQVSRAVDKNRTFSLKNDAFRGIFASVILATVFSYHVFGEIVNMMSQPGYASAGGFSILRAGFFASFGLFASGAFKKESDANEVLEKLVEERTKQIAKQARRLLMVEMALEASETAVAITDAHLRIKWYNHAFKKLTGKHDKIILDHLILESLDTSVSDQEKIKNCFNKIMSLEDEIEVDTASIQIQVGPFVDDEKSFQSENNYGEKKNRYVVILKDFTERRRREKAEEAAEREIVLKQAMAESCQILSHELRTPLQGIIGITSMLLDGQKLDKEVEESLSLVMVSSRLLLTLINNMLDVRKCEANMMSEFEPVSTELFQPMQDSINFCRPLAAVLNVKLDLIPTHMSKVFVASDALRLQQVLINLISNSIKHSSPGCRITVSSTISTLAAAEKSIDDSLQAGPHQDSWDDEYVLQKEKMKVVTISVSDTGNGIDVTQADRLFQRFSQLNDHCTIKIGGNEVPSGTGLGLNLCLKFVQRMKGNIWASNNPDGIGACFSFYLPLLLEEDYNLESPNSSIPKELLQKSIKSSVVSTMAQARRVLLVDDTLINLKVLQRMLKQIGVELTVFVDSAMKALQVLEADRFDIVITDIQMPGTYRLL